MLGIARVGQPCDGELPTSEYARGQHDVRRHVVFACCSIRRGTANLNCGEAVKENGTKYC
jgi:hypothetical protein